MLSSTSYVSVSDVSLKHHSALASANTVGSRWFAAIRNFICTRLSIASVVIVLVGLLESRSDCAQSTWSEDSSAKVCVASFKRRLNRNRLVFLRLSQHIWSLGSILNDWTLACMGSASDEEGKGANFDKLFHCVVWVILMIPTTSCSLNTNFVSNLRNFTLFFPQFTYLFTSQIIEKLTKICISSIIDQGWFPAFS
jgi:hypothetical protein